MEARLRCDGVPFEIYIDGQPVSDGLIKNIPSDAQVIAVGCNNVAGNGGLIAAVDNGLTSDSTWRCSEVAGRDYDLPDFDDSHWSRAFVIQQNPNESSEGNTVWEHDPDFPDYASWISKDKDFGKIGPFYCRGRLREYATSTPII